MGGEHDGSTEEPREEEEGEGEGSSPASPADAVTGDEPVVLDEFDIAAEDELAELASADLRSPEELRAALAEAERLRDEYLDQAQRGRAEYQNLRRRSDESLRAALDRGAERLLSQLLGVLDNFEYVLDALDSDDETPLAKGVRIVHSDLYSALEAAGLEPIPGVGAVFDPGLHEALMSEDSDEPLEEPVVSEVLRRGYRFKGRTLRPASVKVSR